MVHVRPYLQIRPPKTHRLLQRPLVFNMDDALFLKPPWRCTSQLDLDPTVIQPYIVTPRMVDMFPEWL
jgi:hypothetical protein